MSKNLNDHPLALELKSLHSAFENYQHAAHVSALQLQRARSEAADACRRVKLLETENDILKREVFFLRSNVEPIQASRQTTELSLALRRLSDKLSFTEQSLFQKTSECLQVAHALNKSKLELKSMQSIVDSNRVRLEERSSIEDHLALRSKSAEEEAKMAMSVINDYASLVRSLQRDLVLAKGPDTPVSSSSANENGLSTAILDSFQHSRNSLRQLLSEANAETTTLHTEIARLHNELSAVRSDLEVERETSRIDRDRLAEALLEIDRYKVDDMAAEKMVSRYMRFSQSSIDTLQTAVSSLKTRHAATLATLSTTSQMLSKALEEERSRISQMRDILDELTESISRETYGRRREVSLRLRHIAREERLLHCLKNWTQRAEDQYLKYTSGDVAEQTLSTSLLSTYSLMVEEAKNILQNSSKYPELESSVSESVSNVLLAEHLCSSLKLELQSETEKRLELTKRLTEFYVPQSSAPILFKESRQNLDAIDAFPSKDCNTPANVDLVDVVSSVGNSENVGGRSDDFKSAEVYQSSPTSVTENSENVVILEPSTTQTPSEDQIVDPKYEGVQKRFTDCHLTLQQLRSLFLDKTDVLDSHNSLLLNVVLRLDDYCEDARVELEIHLADVERIRRGAQTVRSFQSSAKASTSSNDLTQLFDTAIDNDVDIFQKKLDDLEHDIVQVKAAIYNLESSTSASSAFSVSKPPSRTPPWSLFSSPTTSQHTIVPPPSFGTVITTPKPRRIYSLAGSTSSNDSPYAYLNLRIPMPFQHPPWESGSLASLRVKSNHLRVTRSTSSLYQVGLHSFSRTFDDDTLKTPDLSSEFTVVDNDVVE